MWNSMMRVCARAVLCGRSGPPDHRLIVLNRVTPDDFKVDVSPSFEWKRDGQYCTFRKKDDPLK